jgi:hypothetical protein
MSLLRSGPSLHLYEDRLVYESGHEFEVPYDDVEIVIARTRLGDRLLGTRTYEIVHSTGRNPNMMFMTDPDVFERIVGERVVEPREQYANRRQDARPFWQLWPDHRTERIPEGPIVTADGLEEAWTPTSRTSTSTGSTRRPRWTTWTTSATSKRPSTTRGTRAPSTTVAAGPAVSMAMSAAVPAPSEMHSP